ncbi:hypothetical protein BJ508DRAFT_323069 [Ascobolus immersus RN42]|uniref:Uncharacterized protein n=1 Tax=Ascobolus immersus RN42 TaxID=1160509 RepID=A0A3N4IHH8_ASCIM|nr:hypothetical protein BJ508DRAFT_323069 [Ascobolus immersus RN42]
MPCDREDHDNHLHNLTDWKRNDQSQLIRPCENICNFCYKKFNRACSSLRSHLLSGTGCKAKPRYRHPYAYHASHNPSSGRYRSDAPEEEKLKRGDVRIRWYCRTVMENGIDDDECSVYYRILSNRLHRLNLPSIEHLAVEAIEYTVNTPGLFLEREFPNFGFGPNNTALPLMDFAGYAAEMHVLKKQSNKAKKERRLAKIKVEDETEEPRANPIKLSSHIINFAASQTGFRHYTPPQVQQSQTSYFETLRKNAAQRAAELGDQGLADIWNDGIDEANMFDPPEDNDHSLANRKRPADNSELESSKRKKSSAPDQRQSSPLRRSASLAIRTPTPVTPRKRLQNSRKMPSPEIVMEIKDSQPSSPETADKRNDNPPLTTIDPRLLAETALTALNSLPQPQSDKSSQLRGFPSQSKGFRYKGSDGIKMMERRNESVYEFFYRLKNKGLVPLGHKMAPGVHSLHFRPGGNNTETGVKTLLDSESMDEVWKMSSFVIDVTHSLFHHEQCQFDPDDDTPCEIDHRLDPDVVDLPEFAPYLPSTIVAKKPPKQSAFAPQFKPNTPQFFDKNTPGPESKSPGIATQAAPETKSKPRDGPKTPTPEQPSEAGNSEADKQSSGQTLQGAPSNSHSLSATDTSSNFGSSNPGFTESKLRDESAVSDKDSKAENGNVGGETVKEQGRQSTPQTSEHREPQSGPNTSEPVAQNGTVSAPQIGLGTLQRTKSPLPSSPNVGPVEGSAGSVGTEVLENPKNGEQGVTEQASLVSERPKAPIPPLPKERGRNNGDDCMSGDPLAVPKIGDHKPLLTASKSPTSKHSEPATNPENVLDETDVQMSEETTPPSKTGNEINSSARSTPSKLAEPRKMSFSFDNSKNKEDDSEEEDDSVSLDGRTSTPENSEGHSGEANEQETDRHRLVTPFPTIDTLSIGDGSPAPENDLSTPEPVILFSEEESPPNGTGKRTRSSSPHSDSDCPASKRTKVGSASSSPLSTPPKSPTTHASVVSDGTNHLLEDKVKQHTPAVKNVGTLADIAGGAVNAFSCENLQTNTSVFKPAVAQSSNPKVAQARIVEGTKAAPARFVEEEERNDLDSPLWQNELPSPFLIVGSDPDGADNENIVRGCFKIPYEKSRPKKLLENCYGFVTGRDPNFGRKKQDYILHRLIHILTWECDDVSDLLKRSFESSYLEKLDPSGPDFQEGCAYWVRIDIPAPLRPKLLAEIRRQKALNDKVFGPSV